MSGEGALMMPMVQLADDDRDDVLADIAVSERGAIARRIGAIVAACQKEAVEGRVSLSDLEMRLVVLADDVRSGLHGRDA